jgi:ABC-type nitrate/sulfonate/bicarbonate transport system substrate-binding protein
VGFHGTRAGLFEKYGFDVKLVTIAAGNVILSALLTGSVHLITGAGPQVVAAVAQGAAITIVLTNGDHFFSWLLARRSRPFRIYEAKLWAVAASVRALVSRCGVSSEKVVGWKVCLPQEAG